MIDQSELLNHIVSITESRDIELLELSLLRTMFEVIPCRKAYFIKLLPEKERIKGISCFGPGGYEPSCAIDFIPSPDELLAPLVEASSGGKASLANINDHALSVAPVEVMNNHIGYIAVDVRESSRADSHLIESLVRIYENYVTVLIDNQMDKLTGLLNRKIFDDRILKLIELRKSGRLDIDRTENERRSGEFERFWLGIIDIDDFKKVNDTFGHLYGDEILILVGRIMQGVFRTNDMKFRFGGEEFIIVMQAESVDIARSIFERFRKSVEDYEFPQMDTITVSIGIVEITGEESPPVFVGCADRALYYAKGHGKNMVCVYSELVERGLIAPESIRKGKVIIFD